MPPAAVVLAAVLALAAGCGRTGAAGGDFTEGVHDGRAYWLYAPPSPSPRRLVVALHGCGQTPEDFGRGTRLNEAAAARGLVVLYPAQDRRANARRCWNWFEPRHRAREGGEAGQILALVAEIRRAHALHPERAIVVGLSAGAFMAVNLACAAPDVVGGVGATAGGPYQCGTEVDGAFRCMLGQAGDGESAARQCLAAMGPRRRPVRASLWHGARDTVVSPRNLDALAAMFAALHEAVPGEVRVDGARHRVYRDGAGRPPLETWLVLGMGHAWSGGDARGSYTFPPGPAATSRMLDFLLAGETAP